MRKPILMIIFSLFLISCGSDGSGPSDPGAPTAISGVVVKDRVSSSSVTLHAINTDGSVGSIVAGPFVTNASGEWSGELGAGASGPFYLHAEGGNYVDEASGAAVDIGTGVMLGYTLTGSGTVSPFTQMLFDVTAQADESLAVDEAWSRSIVTFAAMFGFDPTTAIPASSGGTAPASYMATLGGLSLLVDENPLLSNLDATVFEIVMALVADAADQALDGIDFAGQPITVGAGRDAMPVLDADGLDLLVATFNDYADSIAELAFLLFGPIDDLDFGDVTDPVDPGSYGTLELSGPGTSALLTTSFNPSSGDTRDGTQAQDYIYTWSGGSSDPWNIMSLSIIYTYAGNDLWIVTVGFVSSTSENPFSSWITDLGDDPYSVEGLSRAGDIYSFDNVLLDGLNEQGDLTLNGTLEIGDDDPDTIID